MPDGLTGVRRSPIVNLPNAISFGRLCAVPFAVWLVLHREMGAAFLLFALAGITDAVDGWLARRSGGSPLGALLDPMADKALLVSMFVTLAVVGLVPDWVAMLVVFRDVVIVGGVMLLWLTGGPMQVRPSMLSKANTALQIVVVGGALLLAAMRVEAPGVVLGLCLAVAATTLGSGAAYVWRAAR